MSHAVGAFTADFAAQHPGRAVAIDPDDVETLKSLRRRRYVTVQVPALRLVGFGILSAIVAVSNATSGLEPVSRLEAYVAAWFLYAGASWVVIVAA